jgi:hypothetical protein
MTDLANFRKLMAEYAITSRSDEIRLALCELIEAVYCKGLIGREEYHSAMGYIR